MSVEFGWFIPSRGDRERFGDDLTYTPPSLDLFTRVATAAEDAGFEYALVPVETQCWEAFTLCAMVAARTKRIQPLIAARAGLIAPTLFAKMVATFDQLTQGRVRINLIAGSSPAELAADGLYFGHDERYDVMAESVELMKKAWESEEPFDFRGKYFQADGVNVLPKPFERAAPPLYLGGMSEAAQDVCARFADTHLFWGDTPANIGQQVEEMQARAKAYDRTLSFGMRLHVVVRESGEEAQAAAQELIAGVPEGRVDEIGNRMSESVIMQRMQALALVENFDMGSNLWSGIASVKGGAGVAIVGSPEQVASTIRQFVDVGCTSFCLSGFPHDTEAKRFGDLVMPLLDDLRLAADDDPEGV